MKIVITKLGKTKFQGELFLSKDDQDPYMKVLEMRPGCAAKAIINSISALQGIPEDGLVLTIDDGE